MRSLAIKYGIGIAFALVAYFLLLKLIGLHNYPILSAFNGVIYGAGTLLALKRFKAESESFDFLNGFQLGLFTGAIATILFSFFMALYIFQIDTQHMVPDAGSQSLVLILYEWVLWNAKKAVFFDSSGSLR